MDTVKKYLKGKFITNRTLGFFIGLGSAGLSIVLAIVFYIIVFKDLVQTSHEGLSATMVFILMLLGGLSQLLVAFIEQKQVAPMLPLVPAVLCGVGLSIHISLTAYPLADKFTGIEFFGGSASLFVTFAILFALCTIGFIVSCFMKQRLNDLK